MLPLEEQRANSTSATTDTTTDTDEETDKILKTLDFTFAKGLEDEKSYNEPSEKRDSELHPVFHPKDIEEFEKKSDEKENGIIDTMNGEKESNSVDQHEINTTTSNGFDSSNLNSTSTNEQDEVINVLKELENGLTTEPTESIVRASFVDFSLEDEQQTPTNHGHQGGEESNSEELGREFSLTLSPDLPKIRAQQIRNWLEFDKDNTEAEKASPSSSSSSSQDDDRPRFSSSRETSPPQDFELDSLTMTIGGAGLGVGGGGDHTVTDADGLQRRVRFLTDPQGNILLSVFLTNEDGEEEEQQQVIQLENGLPDGMNFPEIESQLAAFVSHNNAQQQQQNKIDLVDTDMILKELGVEKDDGEEKTRMITKDEKSNDEDAVKGKTRISAGTSLSVFDDGSEDVSDSETMSTSSCSSMIEVKPKGDKTPETNKIGLDENNNVKIGKVLESSVDDLEIDDVVSSLTEQISTLDVKVSQNDKHKIQKETAVFEHYDKILTNSKITKELNQKFDTELSSNSTSEPGSKFSPTLVDIEMKSCPPTSAPPPIPTTSAPVKKESFDGPLYKSDNEHVVTVQVLGVDSNNNNISVKSLADTPQKFEPFYSQEQQLESLCIEEEPISAVALTIAKWENFSRKQQAAAESGERVSIAVKGLGKLILPMHSGNNNGNVHNNNGNYVNTAPIKMGGPMTPAKPKKNRGEEQNGEISNNNNNQNGCNNNNNNNGRNNKLWNGFGWGNSNKMHHTLEKALSAPSSSSSEERRIMMEEESIYAQPNSQAGTLTMIVNSSNPSNLLKSYPKPNSRGEIINWFKEGEIHRSGILLSYGQTSSHHHSAHIIPQPTTNPIVVSWFFGLINRQQAEEYLLGQPTGTFLVRISTRVWGYTLSYQSNNKVSNFLISAINPAVAATLNVGPGSGSCDSKNGHPLPKPLEKQQLLFPFSPGGRYAFIGTNMTPYTTLTSLIRHHSHAPITKAGGEKLLYPCPGGPRISGLEYVFK